MHAWQAGFKAFFKSHKRAASDYERIMVMLTLA